jgi:hypothetical protein
LPEIERLVMGMKPSKKGVKTSMGFVFTTDSLYKKIKNILEQGNFKFANGQIATVKQLAQFMYKINFLTARKDLPNIKIDRKYFEENRYLSGDFAEFGYDWEIHPAYRWALQPSKMISIYKEIEFSSDLD